MATGPLCSVPGHSPELRRHPIQFAGYPRAAPPRKAAAAPQDPSRAASCLSHHSLGLQAGLRGPRTPSPLCLSVPVCRMGRHGGTSASCSYRGQPSLLTLAGGPAECGRQRPLTPSSPPSCPGSARGTQRNSETRAPEPRAAYDVQANQRVAPLYLSALRTRLLSASLQACAGPRALALPPVRAQTPTSRLLAQAQNKKIGVVGGRVRKTR